MQRIAGPGALPGGHFSDGNPYTTPKTDGTLVTAAWAESVQEELAAIVEATGRALSTADNAQVLASIRDLIASESTRRRRVYAGCKTGGTSLDSFGLTAPTILGTPSAVQNARGPWLQLDCATPSSTPEDIGVRGPFDAFQRRWPSVDVTFSVDIQTLTFCRLWVGLFSADPSALTDPTSLHCAGFRYEHLVDSGGTWRSVTANGSASTIKDTLSPIAATSSYELRVRHAGAGRFEFLINGALVSVHDLAASESVPGASNAMGPCALLRHLPGDTVNKILRFGFFAA